MNLWNKAKERWNNNADEYNQWHELDIHEIEELVMTELNIAIKEALVAIKKKGFTTSHWDYVIEISKVERILSKMKSKR